MLLKDITFLEMIPVLMAVMLWGCQFRNKRIILNIDNEALVTILNEQTCRYKRTMILVRHFVLRAMRHNIVFKAVHIYSDQNFIADAISRKH